MFDNVAAEAGTDLSLTRLKQQQQQQNRLKLIGHDGQTSLRDCTVWLWTRHMFSHRSTGKWSHHCGYRRKPLVKENSKFGTEFVLGVDLELQLYRKDCLVSKEFLVNQSPLSRFCVIKYLAVIMERNPIGRLWPYWPPSPPHPYQWCCAGSAGLNGSNGFSFSQTWLVPKLPLLDAASLEESCTALDESSI